MALISLCMIVKNEENNLKRCLKSIAHLVDEIIIVDTGSEDDTKKVALQYTKNVFEFEWEKDFSSARNYAASFAKSKWILVMDGDEYIDENNFKIFKNQLFNSRSDILIPKIINFLGSSGESIAQNYHERIYLNNSEIKYDRPIHEHLVSKTSTELIRDHCELIIYHSGYLDQQRSLKSKSTRNLYILDSIKEKLPIDYYYLGNELVSINKLELAIDNYIIAYKKEHNKSLNWILDLLVRLIGCQIEVNRIDDARNIINSCLIVYPNIGEFLYFDAYIYYITKNTKLSIEKFEELYEKREVIETIYSEDYTKIQPLKLLARSYRENKQINESVNVISKAIAYNRLDLESWKFLIETLALEISEDELYHFIENKIFSDDMFSELQKITIIGSILEPKVNKILKQKIHSEKKDLPLILIQSIQLKSLMIEKNITDLIYVINEIDDAIIKRILKIGIFDYIDLLVIYSIEKNKTTLKSLKRLISQIETSQKLIFLKDFVLKNKSKNITKCFEEYSTYIDKKLYFL
ncbi:tetratricopeptide repeat-containing glycosyltransferase family 2 protein [Exiguobacterium acetylicum]|uniref:tetratricopeptide repeat-containing glycosyltransferase family 2 protein n=1 Tax=Exiguobacterium acetylicum TaxID=41170 RepID=UPI001CA73DFA|nr:glycosyltransferase family 2 protein [Exiguobacterium acetylicum]QZY86249.1 glycosyltransferase family 2 protein [Exiguobacterium acetylicum]